MNWEDKSLEAVDPLYPFGFTDPEFINPRGYSPTVRVKNDWVSLEFNIEFVTFNVTGRILQEKKLPALFSDMLPIMLMSAKSQYVTGLSPESVKFPDLPRYVRMWSLAIVECAADAIAGDFSRVREFQYQQLLPVLRYVWDDQLRGAVLKEYISRKGNKGA